MSSPWQRRIFQHHTLSTRVDLLPLLLDAETQALFNSIQRPPPGGLISATYGGSHYCPGFSGRPTRCPRDTFREDISAESLASCLPCPTAHVAEPVRTSDRPNTAHQALQRP
jgi:hypothetical protein